MNRAVQKDGVTAFEQLLEDDAAFTAFQATGGGALLAPLSGLRPSIYRADKGLAIPYSQETHFSVEHLLARDLTASASYESALSRQQQQQRLVFNALWKLPIGDEESGKPAQDTWITRVFGHIEVAPIFTVESGRPVNPLTGVDSNRSGTFPASSRPLGFGRNSLMSPMLMNIDVRVLKYFPVGKTARLDLVAEAFNLFNRSNIVQINPIFGTAGVPQSSFLQPIAGAGARQIQFSLDFEF